MLKLNIICVGRLKEKFFAEAVNEYAKRLSPYCRLNIEEVPEARVSVNASAAEVDAALSKEADAIEFRLPKSAYIVAMCIEGSELDSVKFAQFLPVAAQLGGGTLYILVGGSHGLHPRLKARAKHQISMSKMTFPHHLFRVMLLEAIYRAMKIAEGAKYHK